MEKEPRVVITLEAQVTGETDLKTGIAIHGTPSLTEQYKKQNAEHEADSSEGQTEAKDPEGQA